MRTYIIVIVCLLLTSCEFDLPKNSSSFHTGAVSVSYEPPGFLPIKIIFRNGKFEVVSDPKIKTPIGTFRIHLGLSQHDSKHINLKVINREFGTNQNFHLTKTENLQICLRHGVGNTIFSKDGNSITIDVTNSNLTAEILFCREDCNFSSLEIDYQTYLYKAKKLPNSSTFMHNAPNPNAQYKSNILIRKNEIVEVIKETSERTNSDFHNYVWWEITYKNQHGYVLSNEFTVLKETARKEAKWELYALLH